MKRTVALVSESSMPADLEFGTDPFTEMTAEPDIKVAVCVVTFQRPQGLRRLLQGVASLSFRGAPPPITVIVVDNDAAESARPVCDDLLGELPWPLQYYVEPRRGIPFARNMAVEQALNWADSIAFIDDDEVPEPFWLEELLAVQRRFGADVVTGPVLAELPPDVPHWIAKGRFFESPRHQTGQRREVAFTGNVIVRDEVFRKMTTIFDERMAMTGGTDSHFFRRVHRAGFSIVWADRAIVREYIPRSRASFGWIVRRFFRCGTALGFVAMELEPAWRTRVGLAARGCTWTIRGCFVAAYGLAAGRHLLARGIGYVANGVGHLASLVGTRYEEYRDIHGE